MAMWADNVKFVKDIIDSKYQKIDSAIAEVSSLAVVWGVRRTGLALYSKEMKRISVKIFPVGQLILYNMYEV